MLTGNYKPIFFQDHRLGRKHLGKIPYGTTIYKGKIPYISKLTTSNNPSICPSNLNVCAIPLAKHNTGNRLILDSQVNEHKIRIIVIQLFGLSLL